MVLEDDVLPRETDSPFLSTLIHAKNDTTNPFGYILGESTENKKALLFFSGKERVGAPNDNFRKNICSEDDLRSRIFETFCCKISCLPASPRIFEHLNNGIIAYF